MVTPTQRHFYSAVPQASDFIDTQPLSKGKTEKTKKKKEGKAAQQPVEAGFMTVPAPQTPLLNGDSPGPSGFSSITPSNSASPAPMKAGFSRISSAVDTPTHSGTPVPNDRSKVAFGFATKRKAGDDAGSPPPSKRR